MSGFAEEIECPKCGFYIFHRSTDNSDWANNYGYCLQCGWGYATIETQWSLIELNEERISFELPPLIKLEHYDEYDIEERAEVIENIIRDFTSELGIDLILGALIKVCKEQSVKKVSDKDYYRAVANIIDIMFDGLAKRR